MVKTDLVCLMTLTDQAIESLEHRGVTYYFCSALCKGVFAIDPGWYVSRYTAPHSHQCCPSEQETA